MSSNNAIQNEDNLIKYNEYKLEINDFHVVLDSTGELSNGRFVNNLVTSNDEIISVFYSAGLWLGAIINNEPKANIVWVGSYPRSNYISNNGVSYIDSSTDSFENIYWSIEDSFPLDSNEVPILYGDGMIWAKLESDTTLTENILANPIQNINIKNSIFAYNREDLKNVIFINYQIKINNQNNINEIFCGFYSDTDLDGSTNKTGYDLDRGFTYTYSPFDTINTYVSAIAFLKTPQKDSLNYGVSSHRIMRKNNYINPNFGEYGFNTAQQAIYALNGLDNNGQMMINPITGEVSRYAFTGDPISGEGWLDDQPTDVRSLISLSPISVEENANISVTVVWIVEFGNDLSNALQAVKTKIDDIRNEPSIWDF